MYWEAQRIILRDNGNHGGGKEKVFSNDGSSTTTDYMWLKTITTNPSLGNIMIGAGSFPTIVKFINKSTNPSDIDQNFSRWEAQANILIEYNSDILFEKVNGGTAKTEWFAGRAIDMKNSKIKFLNGTAPNPAFPLDFGRRYDNTVWRSSNDPNNPGSINAENTTIEFINNGRGSTEWYAQHPSADKGSHIILYHHSPTTFEHAASAGKLELRAFYDFTTGHGSPITIKHKTHEYIKVGGLRNNWTASPVNIEIDAAANNGPEIIWESGGFMLIDSTFTFKSINNNPIRYVKLQSLRSDIMVNPDSTEIGSYQIYRNNPTERYYPPRPDACDAARAAVHFTLAGRGRTEWWAKRNIITNDTVHFHYGSNSNVQKLLWTADTGNIDIRRILRVDYGSRDTIRFEALSSNNATPSNKHTVNNSGCYNGTQNFGISTRGNIRTSDSVIINRTNTAGNGLTEFDAYNDIQTAMFNFSSKNTHGDITNINSRMGDIWLGYSYRNPIECTTNNPHSPVSFDNNRFFYHIPVATTGGKLNIKSGYSDLQGDGGNIYFTHIVNQLENSGTYDTEISIPFSNKFICNSAVNPLLGGCDYERAGIVGGVARCQSAASGNIACKDTGLIHRGNNGKLLVDAGTRGNIIINNGVYLNFGTATGNSEFRTRFGDIDMRSRFNVDSVQGSVLLLASSDQPNKENVRACSCDEMRNNVYLQDFGVTPVVNNGNIFIGADNNIKLQYGGLRSINTPRDPFWSRSVSGGYAGYPCGGTYHCDADTSENQARDLILNFSKDAQQNAIASGGMAMVASDLIDVYKNLLYTGGNGSGMGVVPAYNTLHGETVAGYGLYIKAQGNKRNWTMTDHGVNSHPDPTVGAACVGNGCAGEFLHNTARVTFHADARIYAENQKVLIASPVLDTYGNADYNTSLNPGGKTNILVQADSLIYHDSLIIDGPKTQFTTWTAGMERNMPIIKLGHQRFTPPAAEGAPCPDCFTHKKDLRTLAGSNNKWLDTVFVTFRNDAKIDRLHSLVSDHAVISFLTDSFDHINGKPTQNAKFYTDIFKVRNHVELFTKPDHTTDGHFELCSEEQMATKDYAGVYARHLHMEPIAPSCSKFNFSQLWLPDPMLSVVSTSTFGGYGWIHADVHVEIGANLFPGFASLGKKGNCYEQRAGVLKMQDLRLDKGANFKVTIGEDDAENSFAETYTCPATFEKIELGRYADCLVVDSLSIYGTQYIDLEVRSGISLEPGQTKCYPIIQYKKVGRENLNNLKLRKLTLTEKDHRSIDGVYHLTLDIDTVCKVVYVCVATLPNPVLQRKVQIPAVSGVTSTPAAPGEYTVDSRNDFRFKLKFSTPHPLKVMTGRIVDGSPEEIYGTKNANGEFEYVIRRVQQHIVLEIGPGPATKTSADEIAGSAVWAADNKLYIRVDADDIASVYSVTGQLVKQLAIPNGTTTTLLDPGVYVITLKDGSVHKVIVK